MNTETIKVGKKGVIVIPKKFREKLEIEEGSRVTITLTEDSIIIKPLRPKIVDVDPKTVEKIIAESRAREEKKYEEILKGLHNSA